MMFEIVGGISALKPGVVGGYMARYARGLISNSDLLVFLIVLSTALIFLYGCTVEVSGKTIGLVYTEESAALNSGHPERESSHPLPIRVIPIEQRLIGSSSDGAPGELRSVWEAWALLSDGHVDRAEFEEVSPGASGIP